MAYCEICANSLNMPMCPCCRKTSKCIKTYQSGFDESNVTDSLNKQIEEKENSSNKLKQILKEKDEVEKEKSIIEEAKNKAADEVNRMMSEKIRLQKETEEIKNNLNRSKLNLELEIRDIYNKVPLTLQNEKYCEHSIRHLCKSNVHYKRVSKEDNISVGTKIRYFIRKKNGNFQLSKERSVTKCDDNELQILTKDKPVSIKKDEVIFMKVH
jgi:vacuolar-type H+-ATPase subunit I/STV1